MASLANRALASLNAMACMPSSLSTVAQPLSQTSTLSSRLHEHVYSCASEFHALAGRPALAECDGPPPPLSPASGPVADSLPDLSYLPQPATVMPLVASRVALPPQAGVVPLLSVLPPALAKRYAAPNSDLLLPPCSRGARAPATMASVTKYPAQYRLLLRRMDACGMLHWMRAAERDPALPVNGLFAVFKSDKEDRLIIDARPGNRAQVPSPEVELSMPDFWASVRVPAGSRLFVAKCDISNFYHLLLLPEWLWPYFALPPVLADDVGLQGVYGQGCVLYPCVRTVPMGWSHAVFLAQQAHLNVLYSCPAFRREDLVLTRRSTCDYRLDRPRHALVIDDFILFVVAMPGEEAAAVALLRRLQDKYKAVVVAAGLKINAKKDVLPTCDGAEVLGLLVDGRRLTVRLAPASMRALVKATDALMAAGSCSGLELSRLLGKWTWALLVRRPALAAFSAVYTFVQKSGSRVFSLWPSVRRELQVMCGLAPLLFVSLEAPWFPKLCAVDASTWGCGVVRAAAPASVMDSLANAVGLPPSPDRDLVAEHLPEARWATLVSKPWSVAEHINVLEARALLLAVRWVVSHPAALGASALFLSDSSVVVGAVSKGRSSSHALLRVLRPLSAWVLAAGVRPSVAWVPTFSNPADEPSRDSKAQ